MEKANQTTVFLLDTPKKLQLLNRKKKKPPYLSGFHLFQLIQATAEENEL